MVAAVAVAAKLANDTSRFAAPLFGLGICATRTTR
jgi:hypothetical protein